MVQLPHVIEKLSVLVFLVSTMVSAGLGITPRRSHFS